MLQGVMEEVTWAPQAMQCNFPLAKWLMQSHHTLYYPSSHFMETHLLPIIIHSLIIRIAWETQTNFKGLLLKDFCQCFLLHCHNGFFMYLQLTFEINKYYFSKLIKYVFFKYVAKIIYIYIYIYVFYFFLPYFINNQICSWIIATLTMSQNWKTTKTKKIKHQKIMLTIIVSKTMGEFKLIIFTLNLVCPN
jgi:hypothetical protein